jgi:hypothetical protein
MEAQDGIEIRKLEMALVVEQLANAYINKRKIVYEMEVENISNIES